MGTNTSADEFRYIVPARLWYQHRKTVLANAKLAARRLRKRAAGDPDEAHVVLVWRQDADGRAESVA